MSEPAIKELWVFDINRRVYPKNKTISSAPIWREHWVRREIVGETSRSWIDKFGNKYPKKGGRGVLFSQEEIDKAAWVHENRHRIRDEIQWIDYETLKKVAELIGYGSK